MPKVPAPIWRLGTNEVQSFVSCLDFSVWFAIARISGASTASDWSDVQSIQQSRITSLGSRAKGKSLKRLIHLLWSDHGPNIGVVVVGQSRRHIERSGKELEVESQLCRLIDINDLTIWP
ncbi:hypothetical protein EAG_01956 [Camponotus floridanus]|uniref:Uncharacterized protein n=1 Tax=Camponotus floridanus TaxID=104421 RepID=E2A1Z9_CAMFO|nr:hypothetical protein EAG_01956 [Camponotus floridanus]